MHEKCFKLKQLLSAACLWKFRWYIHRIRVYFKYNSKSHTFIVRIRYIVYQRACFYVYLIKLFINSNFSYYIDNNLLVLEDLYFIMVSYMKIYRFCFSGLNLCKFIFKGLNRDCMLFIRKLFCIISVLLITWSFIGVEFYWFTRSNCNIYFTCRLTFRKSVPLFLLFWSYILVLFFR